MNVTDFEIFEYSLPFERPFTVLGQPLASREGVIIRLTSSDGGCGVGETAPLPGLSQELLKKAVFQLKSLRAQSSLITIPADLPEFQNIYGREPFASLCPSVRFGLETAVLHMMAQARRCLPAEIFECPVPVDIPVAGLVQGSPDDIGVQVNKLIHESFRVFKLKVGSKNIPLDVKKVQLVRQLIGSDGILRLDANRAWNLEEAAAFCRSAGRENIEFLEEPLQETTQLEEFNRQTGWPVALDETIWDSAPEIFVFPTGVTTLVIKPALAGGIIQSLKWITKARQEHKAVVISSVFESGVGARMLANLAAFSSSAAGLGTEEWLSGDLLPQLRAHGSNRIPKKSLAFHWDDIDAQKLTRLIG